MQSRNAARCTGQAALLACVLAVSAWARLLHWDDVFTDRGVAFAFDSDPTYHVLQAERFLRGAEPLWFDRWLDWPIGAEVLWPPLFDVTIAGLSRGLHGPEVGRAAIERVAAGLPVVLGVLTVALVAALGRTLLGSGRGCGSAFILALLMGHVMKSTVGAADQHVAEALLSTLLLLAVALALRQRPGRPAHAAAALLAVAACASFWNWMGSALYLAAPLAFLAISYLVDGDEAPVRQAVGALAAGLGGGAALLALTVAAWGAPGALWSGSVRGVTGLHVTLLAAGAAFPATLAGLARIRPEASRRRRLGEVGLAGAASAAALGAIAWRHGGLADGLSHLAVRGPWLQSIHEFQPLLFSCWYPLRTDVLVAGMFYGLAIPAALLSVPALVQRWRSSPAERARIALVACWGGLYLGLALWQRRFVYYAVAPLSVLSWEALAFWARTLMARFAPGRQRWAPALAWAGAATVVLPSAVRIPEIFATSPQETIEALRWLGSQRPSTDGDEGVMAGWNLGHLVRYYADKPVVASPFGTDGGRDALLDTARFTTSVRWGDAEAVLQRRRIGFVVASWPLMDAYLDNALLLPANDVVLRSCSYHQGVRFDYSDAYPDQLAARLWFHDGLSAPDRPAPPLDGLRLIHESASRGTEGIKIFGVVKGARLHVRGGGPGAPVTAEVALVTNRGRHIAWQAQNVAGADGSAELRVPYATGLNGSVRASTWTVRDASRFVRVVVTEQQVAAGAQVEVDLAHEP